MTGLREKVKEIRKNLMKLCCVCSAATPTAVDGDEVNTRLRCVVESGQQMVSVPGEAAGFISLPRQSQARAKKLGITRVFSRILQWKEYRQQVPGQHVTSAGIMPVPHQSQQANPVRPPVRQQVPHQQVPSGGSVPRRSQIGARRNTEIASILNEITGGAAFPSIEEVKDVYEFIERGLTFTRSDLPVFQLSQVAQAPRRILAPRATGAVFEPRTAPELFAPGANFERQAAGTVYEPRAATALFTPGAVFEPQAAGAVFDHRATFEPGALFLARQVVA